MADAYSGIDFDEINEATGLAADEIKCLKVSFKNNVPWAQHSKNMNETNNILKISFAKKIFL